MSGRSFVFDFISSVALVGGFIGVGIFVLTAEEMRVKSYYENFIKNGGKCIEYPNHVRYVMKYESENDDSDNDNL